MSNQANTINTFLMMGRPGSGKGTQAALLAERLGGGVYSSGARLRQMAATGSHFGEKAKVVMSSGGLMPIWVSQYLFEDELVRLEPSGVVVFEGSCRIKEEAERFHEVLEWLERPYKVIYIDVPEEILIERLHKRSEALGRADDSKEVLAERFAKFTTLTTQSIEYFKSQAKLVTINGNQSPEAVQADILKALNLA